MEEVDNWEVESMEEVQAEVSAEEEEQLAENREINFCLEKFRNSNLSPQFSKLGLFEV